MNKIIFPCFCISILFFSCASNSTVSSQVDLSIYQYAAISNVMGYNGDTVLMDMEVKIYDGLLNTRLQMIGDREIDNLSISQKNSLLLVRFSGTESGGGSTVSINFVDYITGRPVASCRGETASLIGESTINRSIDYAINQAIKLFPKQEENNE
ncbi:MAG: hypothetical protein LBG90_09715 [Spirochaetaceae bacterium]|nr:hypothetical protein [Spirochaetaceae bacterium]